MCIDAYKNRMNQSIHIGGNTSNNNSLISTCIEELAMCSCFIHSSLFSSQTIITENEYIFCL